MPVCLRKRKCTRLLWSCPHAGCIFMLRIITGRCGAKPPWPRNPAHDGRITDSKGKTVDFKNTILIMTSNIGSEYLLEGIDENGEIKPEASAQVMAGLKNHFRPEFLNRLDEIIMFKPLDKASISGIVNLLLADLNKRIADKELTLKLTDAAMDHVIEAGYDPHYGARPLKRYLQKNVETLVAKSILSNELRAGDTITLDYDGNALYIKK